MLIDISFLNLYFELFCHFFISVEFIIYLLYFFIDISNFIFAYLIVQRLFLGNFSTFFFPFFSFFLPLFPLSICIICMLFLRNKLATILTACLPQAPVVAWSPCIYVCISIYISICICIFGFVERPKLSCGHSWINTRIARIPVRRPCQTVDKLICASQPPRGGTRFLSTQFSRLISNALWA